ncbi:MAG: ATP-binding protein [Chloroflexota bacterium]
MSESINDTYAALAAALNALPNGFPRTPSGFELKILRRIFSPEEARMAAQLSRESETPEAVGERCGLPAAVVAVSLKAMAKRGLVWPDFDRAAGIRRYRLAPFIVGIYEAQRDSMDHELAHLVEHYMADGGAAGMMSPQPALQRVVPARGSVASEWILPYDDVVAIVKEGNTFSVGKCICREQQEELGTRRCDNPLDLCLTINHQRRPARAGDISLEEALAVVARAEELGLVHSVSNFAGGLFYVCNCCGCCCGILRGINDWGIAASVARANYRAEVDAALCTGCEVCAGRCQMRAIASPEGLAVVDAARCIGCGLCVTGCPSEAVRLVRLPDAETIHPPADFLAWEEARLAYRHAREHGGGTGAQNIPS